MNSLDAIKAYFMDLPEVKRIKELEPYIDNNKEIKAKFKELKEIQKQMVNSKEYNQFNQLKALKVDYELKRKELLNLPFVEEYLELLDIVDNMLVTLADGIENNINKKING